MDADDDRLPRAAPFPLTYGNQMHPSNPMNRTAQTDGATGNRVGGVKPSRGFESHPLRSFRSFAAKIPGSLLTPERASRPPRTTVYCNPLESAPQTRLLAECLVHRPRSCAAHARQYVGVGVERDGNGGVPEEFLDVLRVNAPG